MSTESVACPKCGHVNENVTGDSECAGCGVLLLEARLQQISADIRKTTERMEELSAPSFNSFNGIGTTLLDYRELPDGTWEATRWFTIILPVFPLAAYQILPKRQEHSYGRQQSYFSILGKRPLSVARVLRVYGLVFVGLFPIVWGSLNNTTVNRTLGGTYAFFAMLACVAWAGYVVFWKIRNDGKAYRAKTAGAASQA